MLYDFGIKTLVLTMNSICLANIFALVLSSYASEIILKKLQNETDLQKCLNLIVPLLPEKPVVNFLNFNKNYSSLDLKNTPTIRGNKIEIIIKTNVVLLTIKEENFESVFMSLNKSLEWNPRARFIVIFEGKVSKLFVTLKKYFVFNFIVISIKSSVEVFLWSPLIYNSTETVIGSCVDGKSTGYLTLPKAWINQIVKIVSIPYPPFVRRTKYKNGVKYIGNEVSLIEEVCLNFNKF